MSNKEGIAFNEKYLKRMSNALKTRMVKKCPNCSKVVFKDFRVCPYCDYDGGDNENITDVSGEP